MSLEVLFDALIEENMEAEELLERFEEAVYGEENLEKALKAKLEGAPAPELAERLGIPTDQVYQLNRKLRRRIEPVLEQLDVATKRT